MEIFRLILWPVSSSERDRRIIARFWAVSNVTSILFSYYCLIFLDLKPTNSPRASTSASHPRSANHQERQPLANTNPVRIPHTSITKEYPVLISLSLVLIARLLLLLILYRLIACISDTCSCVPHAPSSCLISLL